MTDAPATDLVGRHAEQAALQAFLTRAVEDGAALVLTGEAGVGKTALLAHAVDQAAGVGVHLLQASGVEFESDVSFAGLHQLVHTLDDLVDGLEPAQGDALRVALGMKDGPPADPAVVCAATLGLVRRAARHRPVLMVVDDLAWIDRASALVFGYVARRLVGSAAGFLAAQRAGQDSYFDATGVDVLPVAPLDPTMSAVLLRARFPALAASVTRRLVTDAAGVPLALLELPRELTGPQQTADTALPPTLALSHTLQSVFEARVNTLPASTRDALLLAALDGRQDGAADRGPQIGLLVAAERARLVRVDQATGHFEFVHPLIRAAVVGRATGGERRDAHGRLAERHRDRPDVHARHRAEAALGPDEEAARLNEESAYRAARRGDSVGAVTILLRAAALSPAGASRARRLAEAAGLAARETGAVRDVPALLAQARLADPDFVGSLASAANAVYSLLNTDGDIDSGHRLLVAALEDHELDASTDRNVEQAVRLLMMMAYFGGRAELWRVAAAAIARFGADLSPVFSVSIVTLADPARCTPHVLARLDALIAGINAETDVTVIDHVSQASLFVDRFAACRAAQRRLTEHGRAGGAVAAGSRALIATAFDSFMTGEWAEASRCANEGLNISATHGYPVVVLPARYVLILLAAAQGDTAKLNEISSQMLQWAIPRGAFTVRSWTSHAAGLAALGAGDFDAAFACYASISEPGTFPAYEPMALWVLMDLVDAAVHAGRHDAARAHVAASDAAGIGAISPRLEMLCAGARAMVADSASYSRLFDEALASPGADEWPFYRARIQLAFGERLRRAKNVTAARVQLAGALIEFERLDAKPWVERARVESDATSSTRRRSGSDTTSPLTPQERQIALLAAEGLTNRQIAQRLSISPRTVSAHLYRVFPKVGVTSRAALRDALNGSSEL